MARLGVCCLVWRRSLHEISVIIAAGTLLRRSLSLSLTLSVAVVVVVVSSAGRPLCPSIVPPLARAALKYRHMEG